MKGDRLTRVNTLLQHELGQALFRVINEPDFDPAAVTITRVDISSNLRQAQVYVSIRGTDAARHAMFRHLLHHRADLQALLNRVMTLKYTPHLNFHLDDSLQEGDRILGLIQDLEQEHPEWTGDEGESPDEPS